MLKKQILLRLTNGNCYAAYSAARVPENCSRASPFVQFSSTTFCRLLELLRNSFIATAKTSVTCNVMCNAYDLKNPNRLSCSTAPSWRGDFSFYFKRRKIKYVHIDLHIVNKKNFSNLGSFINMIN